VRFDQNAEDRSLCRIRRERANCDGLRGIEYVILDNDAGSWLSGVGTSTRDRPDLAPLHSSLNSLIASTNAWSSTACSLAATAAACRRASALKDRARTSGTQIWIGRSPILRSLSRWARTLSLDDLDFSAILNLHHGYM